MKRGQLAVRVYVAYGTPSDQIIALRLQALAAVQGLTVYVPPAYTRGVGSTALDPQSEALLRESDVVLGVVTGFISEFCRQELNTAMRFGKRTIILAEPGSASLLQPHFAGSLVITDPANPERTLQAIVQFLAKADIEQNAKKLLIALGTLALALVLFPPKD